MIENPSDQMKGVTALRQPTANCSAQIMKPDIFTSCLLSDPLPWLVDIEKTSVSVRKGLSPDKGGAEEVSLFLSLVTNPGGGLHRKTTHPNSQSQSAAHVAGGISKGTAMAFPGSLRC